MMKKLENEVNKDNEIYESIINEEGNKLNGMNYILIYKGIKYIINLFFYFYY